VAVLCCAVLCERARIVGGGGRGGEGGGRGAGEGGRGGWNGVG
jgi:hypothetical protein